MQDETGHRHDESGKAHAAHEHAVSRAGQPGKASRVTRTMRMQTLDTMHYAPEKLTVKSGQTVRFIVTDAGKLKHEFTIGDAEEQRQYAEMMKGMLDMKHDGGNAVSLEPGQTKELIWRFGKPANVEIACHIPGHYEAGMHRDSGCCAIERRINQQRIKRSRSTVGAGTRYERKGKQIAHGPPAWRR
jgi:uncharacterized cupredoxin-like copper-binding protein